MAIDYRSPLIPIWNESVEERLAELHTVIQNQIVLDQFPNKFNRVLIDTMVEIEQHETITLATQFKVNYSTGIITVDSSLEGTAITVTRYYGRGVWAIPASRIYTELSGEGDITEYLTDLITNVNSDNDDAVAAEALRVIAEDSRVSVEAARVVAEDAREVAEALRVTNTATAISDLEDATDSNQVYPQPEVADITARDALVPSLGWLVHVLDIGDATAAYYRYNGSSWIKWTSSTTSNVDALMEAVFTPDYSTETEATASIISYDPTGIAVKGQLSVSLEGNTDTNIFREGNFSDASEWLGANSTTAAVSNVLSVTGNGTSAVPRTYQTTNFAAIVGNKIYVRAKVRVTNANCSSIQIQIQGSTGGGAVTVVEQTSPVQNTWYPLTGVGILPSGTTGNIFVVIKHNYADAATANTKVMEIDGANGNGVLGIDLTARLGAGNEPSAANAALRYPSFFDATKSTFMDAGGEVKSVGKNLFDIDSITPGKFWETNGTESVLASSFYKWTKVSSSASYYITIKNNHTSAIRPLVLELDQSGSVLVNYYAGTPYASGTTYNRAINVSSNTAYISISVLDSPTSVSAMKSSFDIQVEPGTATTAHTPHEHTTLTIPAGITLRSLPNGTKDELTDDGIHTQRIGVKAYNGTEAWVQSNTNTNTYIMRLDNSLTNNLFGASGNAKLYFANGESFNYVYVTDDYEHIYFINGNVYIVILKTKVDSQAGASIELKFKAYLAGNQASLNYQLLVPIVTYIEGIGQLLAYPNGTLIITPGVLTFDARPDASGVITSPYAADALKNIVSVESVKPITVSEDGKLIIGESITPTSFNTTTITNVAYDDAIQYRVVYKADPANSTLCSTTYSFPINRSAQADSTAQMASQTSAELVSFERYMIRYAIDLEERIVDLETP